jgi:DNA-binding SARP family transcriptional activator/tetratricopeptide (TPR) repeat protein
VEIRLLGPVRIGVADRVLNAGVRKQRFVLAVLALEANRPVSTDRLVALVWPEDPPATARGMIHTYVSGLRAVLSRAGPAGDVMRLDREEPGYVLRCDPERVDLHRFRALVAAARQATGDEHRARVLSEALALWRGPALAGVTDEDTRARLCRGLEEARLTAVEDLIDARLRLGGHGELIDELIALTGDHPYRPRLAGALMRALHHAGRTAEALRTYQDLRRRLSDELGLDPPPDLRELHLATLRGEPGATAPQPPEHADPAPGPGRTATAPGGPERGAPRPAQLPATPATFTGRTAELDRLLGLVPGDGPPSTVLIGVIDGMAGVGKTALAVHAAHRLAPRFPDGQLFLDLHGHTQGIPPVEPAAALDRMLRALGLPGERIPPHPDDRAVLLRSVLAGRRMLILLDNAAGESQVTPLLPGAPGCLVLVTSRARLAGLEAATPLSLDVLPHDDALALFTRTADVRCPDGEGSEPLSEIVELCGRLPLAIRLAAARLRSRPGWTAAHLADRLRDGRQRLTELRIGPHSVTAAIDLSRRHLAPDRERMFRLLGLHPGADIDAHAAAALADTTVRHARRLLDDLVDAHLLQEPTAGRYRFHDLLRAYAVAAEETRPERHAALTRLCDHYERAAAIATNLVYPYEPDRRVVPEPAEHTPDFADPGRAAAWLDAEIANLLAVAGHAAEHGLPSHTLNLSATLHRYLRTRADYGQARALHTHALDVARAIGDRDGELDALWGLGYVHWLQCRFRHAADCFAQALDIGRDIGDRLGELRALWGLGHTHLSQGLHGRAADHYGRALEIARAIGDRDGELHSLIGLGHTRLKGPGGGDAAADLFGQALDIALGTGNRVGELYARNGLGHAHRLRDRDARAAGHYRRALRIAGDLGDRTGELQALNGLGHLHRRRRELPQATDCYRRSLEIARSTGDRTAELRALTGLAHIHRQRERHGEAVRLYRQALDIARRIGDRAGQLKALDGLARTHDALGHPEHARRFHAQALDLRTDPGTGDPSVTGQP